MQGRTGGAESRISARIFAAIGAVSLLATMAACSTSGSASSAGDRDYPAAVEGQADGGYDGPPASDAYSSDDASGSDGRATDSDAGEAARPGDESAALPESDSSASAGGSDDAGGFTAIDQRDIIRTADITVQIPVEPEEDEKKATPEQLASAVADAARALRNMATTAGGYVSASDGGGSSMSVTLRIPAGNYDSIISRLDELGDVSNVYEYTEDVTGQLVDIGSRIKTMTASLSRLRSLLAEATDLSDVISLEGELSRREADLESLQSRQAQLTDLVGLATVSVTVTGVTAKQPLEEEPADKPTEHSAFVAGLIAGWNALAEVGRGAAELLGRLVPFLVPLLLIGAGIALAVRRSRRRRAPHAPAGSLPTVFEPSASGTGVEGSAADAAQVPESSAAHAAQVGPDISDVHENPDEGGQPK